MSVTVPQSRAIESGCVWTLLPVWIAVSVIWYFTGGILRTDRLVLDILFCLGLLGAGLYAAWERRLSAATLTADEPPAPGRDFSASIAAPLPSALTSRLAVRVTLDSPGRRNRRTLWEAAADPQAYEGTVTFTVHVPQRLVHELTAGCTWSVDLSARRGRMPYRAVFIFDTLFAVRCSLSAVRCSLSAVHRLPRGGRTILSVWP
jgi:hypothetical protein